MNTYDKIIKEIEMVADDLYDMAAGNVTAGGYRSMAAILRTIVPLIEWKEKVLDEMEERCKRLSFNSQMNAAPSYTDLLFAIEPEGDSYHHYYLVGQYESSTGTYVRAIDKEPILDKVVAWKEINA